MGRAHADGLGDFTSLYDATAERVLVYLAKRCVDPEVAVDLMAETFAQAFAGRHRYRGTSDAEAEAWVFGIARRKLADYFRRGRAEQTAVKRIGIDVPALGADEQARIEELADFQRIRDAVAVHFERLSAGQQEALRLRVIEERSYADVAARLRVSEDTARARVSRALRRLGASLDEAFLVKGAAGHD